MAVNSHDGEQWFWVVFTVVVILAIMFMVGNCVYRECFPSRAADNQEGA